MSSSGEVSAEGAGRVRKEKADYIAAQTADVTVTRAVYGERVCASPYSQKTKDLPVCS